MLAYGKLLCQITSNIFYYLIFRHMQRANSFHTLHHPVTSKFWLCAYAFEFFLLLTWLGLLFCFDIKDFLIKYVKYFCGKNVLHQKWENDLPIEFCKTFLFTLKLVSFFFPFQEDTFTISACQIIKVMHWWYLNHLHQITA